MRIDSNKRSKLGRFTKSIPICSYISLRSLDGILNAAFHRPLNSSTIHKLPIRKTLSMQLLSSCNQQDPHLNQYHTPFTGRRRFVDPQHAARNVCHRWATTCVRRWLNIQKRRRESDAIFRLKFRSVGEMWNCTCWWNFNTSSKSLSIATLCLLQARWI